jgi:hypothetical protein
MDRPDEHFGKASHFAQSLTAARDDPFLQLRGGLVGKGKRNDIARCEPATLAGSKQVDDSARDDLRLTRPGAGDELEVIPLVFDCATLSFRKLHTSNGAPARAKAAFMGGRRERTPQDHRLGGGHEGRLLDDVVRPDHDQSIELLTDGLIMHANSRY